VEQARPAEPVGRAQVELDGAGAGVRFQAGGPLGRGEVAGQRYLRGAGGHFADGISDDQLVVDECQGVPSAEDGIGRVEDLGQSRPGPAAEGGERIGEA
jgi:hypothetical protein